MLATALGSVGSMFGVDLLGGLGGSASSALSALGSSGLDLFGKMGGSAYDAHLQRQLMSRQQKENLENWYTQLVHGPELQREGLESAGYNPLLALSGFSVPSVGGVSIPSGYGTGSSLNLGSSAMQAAKSMSEMQNMSANSQLQKTQAEVNKQEIPLRKAQVEQAEQATRESESREKRNKMETMLAPVKVAATAAAGATSAYGAKKIMEKVAPKIKDKVPDLLPKSSPFVKSLSVLSPVVAAQVGSAFANRHAIKEHYSKQPHWKGKNGIERNPAWIYGGVPVW